MHGTSQNNSIDEQELRIALSLLVHPEQGVELRSLPGGKSCTGSLADIDKLVDFASREGRSAKGIYYTLNPIDSDLGKAARDEHILKRQFLLIDVDPVRPPDTNSTDEEKEHAFDTICEVMNHLNEKGFPCGILVDSGNGHHGLYRIELPNDEASTTLTRGVLKYLASHFDSETAKVDTKVFNASRIAKLPGTWARKGPHSDERPHRLARFVRVPDSPGVVPEDLLRALIPQCPNNSTRTPTHEANGRHQSRDEVYWRAVAYISACDPAVSGQRGHDATYWPARVLAWGFDLGEDLAFRILRDHFNDRCNPSWSEAELRHKCRDADTKPFSKPRGWLRDAPLPERNGTTGHFSPPPSSDEIHLTDRGNAIRLVNAHGANLRHCHPWRKWLTWDGQRWCPDKTGAVITRAKDIIAELFRWALDAMRQAHQQGDAVEVKRLQTLQAWALKSESAKLIGYMIDLARSEPGIPILPDDMDNSPWLLNVANGTLDLHTGKLREHDRRDLFTKLCPTRYVPDATCCNWLRFLDAVFEADDELILFVQRMLGRYLTGDVSEQILPIYWGTGANGKSTLVNAVLETLGTDYAMKAPASLLMTGGEKRHPTELADLHGKRLATVSETSQGGRLNETLVKDLTGGEPIRARRMREDFWEFTPTHKIIMLTNHKPVVQGRDEGIWRRLRLVPFNVCFWDPADPRNHNQDLPSELCQDKQLPDKLRSEHEGILAWLVRGCLDWQRNGMNNPEKVRLATTEYRAAEDLIGHFINERCTVGSKEYRCKASDLHTAYRDWMEKAGEHNPLSQRKFGEQMNERGFEKYTSNGVWYRGIGVRN